MSLSRLHLLGVNELLDWSKASISIMRIFLPLEAVDFVIFTPPVVHTAMVIQLIHYVCFIMFRILYLLIISFNRFLDLEHKGLIPEHTLVPQEVLDLRA